MTKLSNLIQTIVTNDHLHAKWLNTLSMMENTGARKISRYEHPSKTNITVLKHAAEEARHAYYLKKQISKLEEADCPDYTFEYLLAPVKSYQYLLRLDAYACRYLQAKGFAPERINDIAYLLVTYAIEVRADDLYEVYQTALTAAGSKVNVKSIIMEEAGHLEEMTRMLNELDANWKPLANDVCAFETELYNTWIDAVVKEVA